MPAGGPRAGGATLPVAHPESSTLARKDYKALRVIAMRRRCNGMFPPWHGSRSPSRRFGAFTQQPHRAVREKKEKANEAKQSGVSRTGLTACEERDGPAERAGEQIDEAVDEAEDALD